MQNQILVNCTWKFFGTEHQYHSLFKKRGLYDLTYCFFKYLYSNLLCLHLLLEDFYKSPSPETVKPLTLTFNRIIVVKKYFLLLKKLHQTRFIYQVWKTFFLFSYLSTLIYKK